MKKLTYNENELLINGLMFCFYRGNPSSMCEDGREAYGYLESFLAKELEPFLDKDFEVEIENYGLFSFRHRDWRTSKYTDQWYIEDMRLKNLN